MKIIFKKNLISSKALDIDFKLNKPKNVNIGDLYKLINDVLKNATGINGKRNLIPDNAKIERFDYDVNDLKKIKELLNMIRRQNKEDIFVFFDIDDVPRGIVKNYTIVYENSIHGDSLTNLIFHSDYFILIKMSEVNEEVTRKNEKESQQENSLNLQKEKFLVGRKKEFQDLFKKFEEKLKTYKEKYGLGFQDSDEKEDKPYNITISEEKKSIKDFKVGEYVLNAPNRDGNITGNILIVDEITYNQMNNTVDLVFSNVNKFKETNNARGKNRDIDANMKLYEVFFKENPKEEPESEDFVPEFDYKEALKKGQSFPKNLFPKNNGGLSDLWEEMLDFLNDKSIARTRESAFSRLTQTTEAQSYAENLKKKSNFLYTDKSGYVVDLSKYFTKLLELPPKVPQRVKDMYREIFINIEKRSKELLDILQKSIGNEDYEMANRITRFLKDYSPKAFNLATKHLLTEENYNKRQIRPYTEKRAVSELENLSAEAEREFKIIEESQGE